MDQMNEAKIREGRTGAVRRELYAALIMSWLP